MKYIASVESNLKNHERETKLYPKTLIIAANKAGKSAIVNAIELALTATVSDVVGRPLVKEVNRLLSLSREERLWARVVVSNGESDNMEERATVEWATKSKKGSFIAQPVGLYNPVTVFPLRLVREALSGAADTTRKFFIRFVAGKITDEDVLREIPGPLREAFTKLTTAIPRTAPVDMLLAGLGRAQDRLREVRAEVSVRKDVVQETGQTLPPLPSEKEYEATTKRIAEIEVTVAEMDRKIGRADADALLRAQYLELRQEKELLEHRHDELLTKLAEVEANWPVMLTEVDKIRLSHLAVLRFARDRNLETCPTCKMNLRHGVYAEPGVDMLPSFWRERVATVEAAQEKSAARVEAYHAHEVLHGTTSDEIDKTKEELAVVNARLEGLGTMPDEDPTALSDAYGDAKAELEVLRQQLRGMDIAKAAWLPVLRARDTAVEKEAEVDRLVRLIDALKLAIGNLLDKGRDAFVKRVQAFLPEGDTFGLVLRDEDREVCQYGLVRDGKLHEALSGVEWAYVTAAIAAASIPDDERDKLHVIVFEDRSWDANTLLAVCNATTKLDAQVIIATAPPDGWTRQPFPPGWIAINPAGQIIGVADEADDFQKVVEEGKDERMAEQKEAVREVVTQLRGAPPPPNDDNGPPKFVRDYLEAHPQATAEDLVREFKIAPNRAFEFCPPKAENVKRRGRKPPAAPKDPPPKRTLPPELE